jgi:hypothetical protein
MGCHSGGSERHHTLAAMMVFQRLSDYYAHRHVYFMMANPMVCAFRQCKGTTDFPWNACVRIGIEYYHYLFFFAPL